MDDNINWNLYGGCDIESAPKRTLYPEYLFNSESSINSDFKQELDNYSLKPIKDRHKQLIQQYVESNGRIFDEAEYEQLFNYISEAYNYKKPLV